MCKLPGCEALAEVAGHICGSLTKAAASGHDDYFRAKQRKVRLPGAAGSHSASADLQQDARSRLTASELCP